LDAAFLALSEVCSLLLSIDLGVRIMILNSIRSMGIEALDEFFLLREVEAMDVLAVRAHLSVLRAPTHKGRELIAFFPAAVRQLLSQVLPGPSHLLSLNVQVELLDRTWLRYVAVRDCQVLRGPPFNNLRQPIVLELLQAFPSAIRLQSLDLFFFTADKVGRVLPCGLEFSARPHLMSSFLQLLYLPIVDVAYVYIGDRLQLDHVRIVSAFEYEGILLDCR